MLLPFGRRVALLMLLAGIPANAVAQEEIDPSQTARFRFGPLRFTPSITLSNLGVDNNVFNDPVDPKQDTVGSFGPAADYWMHFGSSLASGKSELQYLYFDKYQSERGWNTVQHLKWQIPLARFAPFAEGAYSNTKNRTGFEIDARARLTTETAGVGTDLRLTPNTHLVLGAKRTRLRFDEEETFLDVKLGDALNRTSDRVSTQLRYRVTSLTTFVVDAEGGRDRFTADPLRNADTFSVMPGFELKPSALISGRVFVGFRNFTPLNAAIPRFRGPAASVDAAWTARATRLSLQVGRDVSYSYQEIQPYYTLTDVTLGVTERLTYNWDVVARAGRQLLDYTALESQTTQLATQLDTIRQYTGGVGYWFGRTLRLGVDGTYYRRQSTIGRLREAEGVRIGASISYGIPQ